MDSLFYLVWRNCYLRSFLRNKVCQGRIISVHSLVELKEDHHYLSLFKEQDKLDNRIFIRLNIKNKKELEEYINLGELTHVVNDLGLTQGAIALNFEGIPQNVIHRLTCYVDRTTVRSSGTIPKSITELIVPQWEYRYFNCPTLDVVLGNLPTTLRKLALPFYYIIDGTTPTIELPSSLEDLDYQTKNISNLRKLAPPSTRVYTNCQAYVNTLHDLEEMEWIQSTPWIGNLKIKDNRARTQTLTPGMIPLHIKEMLFYHNGSVEQGIFPQNLIKLEYRSAVPIDRLMVSQLHQLKYLDINNFNQQLDKGMLPSTLETLIMENYNSPLLPGVFPARLSKLDLKTFNQEVNADVLPQSLSDLNLHSFNQELKPFVLPTHLKKLGLRGYTGTIVANALPCLLTSLILNSITGTFEHAPQLNHLSFFFMSVLHQSASQIISNTNKIMIVTETVDQEFNIQQSSIHHLDWFIVARSKRSTLTPNLIPNQIKTLKLTGIDILSKGLIPPNCKLLMADIQNLDLNLIPSSTKYKFKA